MAETERRPHRSSSINSNNNNNATSSSSSTDLFICFTSRFSSSSSSMRLSSLSPARSACLTTSLSRRLRTSGSSKKNASAAAGVFNSPMFGSNVRKRSGSGYETNNSNNIEPSSPKVTCIGQVRVKTRKHVKKKMRSRSTRKGIDSSFRRSRSVNEQNDGGGGCRFDAAENRWVHLPVTICDSLRSFGSDLNCFFPCRSDSNGNRDRDGRREEIHGGGSSCGDVFTRWFVAVEETGGKRREIELVVGGEDDDVEDRRRRSRRRHVFEGIDLSEIEMMKTEKKERGGGGGEGGRISVCSPPKNALLLMRCRSDPVKVAALANRFKERQMSLKEETQVGGEEEEEEEEDEERRRRRFEMDSEDKKRIELCENWISGEAKSEKEVIAQVSEAEVVEKEEESVKVLEDLAVEEEEEEASKIEEVDSFQGEIEAMIIKTIEGDIRNAIEEEEKMAAMEEEEEEEEEEESKESVITPNVERSEQGNREPDPSPEVIRRRDETTTEKTTTTYKVLPDCLLLMMCEPKLSMEVSKETWVCSTDFVRCLPGRPPAKKLPEAAGDNHQQHQPRKRIVATIDSNASSRRRSIDKPPLLHQSMLQPPRSSCSYPAAPPLIAEVGGEQKLAGANKAQDRLMLPRCKSEPRKSASRLAPEACFWKNRKLEPHSPATVGVGAAGVGF